MMTTTMMTTTIATRIPTITTMKVIVVLMVRLEETQLRRSELRIRTCVRTNKRRIRGSHTRVDLGHVSLRQVAPHRCEDLGFARIHVELDGHVARRIEGDWILRVAVEERFAAFPRARLAKGDLSVSVPGWATRGCPSRRDARRAATRLRVDEYRKHRHECCEYEKCECKLHGARAWLNRRLSL